MKRLEARGPWLAGVALAAAVGGGALVATTAAAQTPPPGGPPLARPALGAPVPLICPAPAPPSAEAIRAMRSDFAERLAAALGKPRADVELALREVDEQFAPPSGEVTVATHVAPTGELAAVAARLGVSEDELFQAMEGGSASQCLGGPLPQQGAAPAIRLDAAALFEGIAERLGRGITGAQVQAAFEASRPSGPPPDQIAFSVGPAGAHLDALAKALGVTVEQLDAALRSIAPATPGIFVPRPRE